MNRREALAAKREEKKQKELERRKEIIEKYSLIVQEMPEEVQNLLGSKMGSIEITAQSSFLAHFKYAIPKYDEETFRIKFIELFSVIGERVINRTIMQKKKNDGMANEKFWREFEVLFEEVPDAYGKKKGIKHKLRIVTKSIRKIIKLIRKFTFWF